MSSSTIACSVIRLGILMSLSAGAWAKRIDTHHHAIPQVYRDAIEKYGENSGFPTPEWSLEATLELMDQIGTERAILSVTTPGPPIAGSGEEGRQLARDINEYFGKVMAGDEGKGRLGFFGALPDFCDVEGTLTEIDFLLEEQKLAHGVAIASSYGDGKLPGDEEFARIWERLNSYKALVFLHPGELPGVKPQYVAGGLPSPIVDFPLATTRAGVDLVLTGTMGANPDIDILLSHAGGTIPFIGSRIINSLFLPDVASTVNITKDEAQEGFARFYHDTALSVSDSQLHGLLDFTSPEKVLFGSDFPYAATAGILGLNAQYQKFVKMDPRGSALAPEVLLDNAETLLARHKP